jgi:hypothetical protein
MDTQKCDNCGTPCGPDDMFCENCGYDFITGSLPDQGDGAGHPGPVTAPDGGGPDPVAVAARSAQAPSPAAGALPAAPSVLDPVVEGAETTTGPSSRRIRLAVAVDRDYFEQMVSDGEIDFPDPVPADTELELAGAELHIGRTSESRAIHPDIDVADLTGDQAVSSRHAVIRSTEAGTCTITDVGSTNGTFLDRIDSDAIDPGVPVEVEPGTPIYVGAWTRLTILDRS